MAILLRSALKLNNSVSRLSQLYKTAGSPKIVQPACSIFTLNKKKDAVSIPVSEKEDKEVERLDNLLEKDEVCCSAALKSSLLGPVLRADQLCIYYVQS